MKDINVSAAKQGRAISDSRARELVAGVEWNHAFELRPGLVTPGRWPVDGAAALDTVGVPQDLTGLTALDVGALDGVLTFELERRGAESHALDIRDPTDVGFAVARTVLRSKATHYRCSVYQLPFDPLTDLDVVLFRGVWYHLKHPILAFERLSESMKIGATLHFEGEAFIDYAEDIHGKSVPNELLALATSDVPVCLSYPNNYKGASNWFIPNRAALQSWLKATGFEVNEIHEYVDPNTQRLYGYATKVADPVSENPYL